MESSAGLSRREFLQTSAALGLSAVAGPSLTAAPSQPRAKNVIQICLLGGPSQLDTWDPKPDAAADIRGPFRSIQTNVPGIRLSENFPRLAQMADRFALLRTIYHKEAPIHETGLQLTQTGRLFTAGKEWPHYIQFLGSVAFPARPSVPSWLALPRPLRNGCTGMDISPGQKEDCLVEEVGWDYCALSTLDEHHENLNWRYGRNSLGTSLLAARFLTRYDTFRFITVNMFETVFGQTTWDCHANGGDLNSTLADYRRTLCPMLDHALATLLDDLEQTGQLDETLVVCLGEFGRTPKINRNGGRDHWPGCWTGLIAGGGVRGGQVIGLSDAHAAEPKDRPIHASEIVATVYHAFGIDSRLRVEAEPIRELF